LRYCLNTFNHVVATLSKVNADLMSAQAAALKAQDEQAQLAKKVRELEGQLADVARWEAVSQQYKLRAIVPEVYVYEYVATGADAEAPHFACTNCFQLRVRSILQLTHATDSGKRYRCPQCHGEIYAGNPDYKPPRMPVPHYGPHGWMA
jgi:hypothetical protein